MHTIALPPEQLLGCFVPLRLEFKGDLRWRQLMSDTI